MKTKLKLQLYVAYKHYCLKVDSILNPLVKNPFKWFKHTFSLCLVFVSLTPDLLSQVLSNEEILHDRYWSYRERFRKYFTVVGKEAGNRLPFSNLVIQDLIWTQDDELGNNKTCEIV